MPTAQPLNYLITGAARGIGRGLSRLLLSKGHRVLLVDSNEAELTHVAARLASVVPAFDPTNTATAPPAKPRKPSAKSLREDDGNEQAKQPFSHLVADLRHQSSIQRIADHASSFFDGHLDVLVNNAVYQPAVGGAAITDRAGYAAFQAPRDQDAIDDGAPQWATGDGKGSGAGKSVGDAFAENWYGAVETNLTAAVMLSRACIPLLQKYPLNKVWDPNAGNGMNTADSEYWSWQQREDGEPVPAVRKAGSIIHISSTRAHQAEANHEAYSATKAGLLGLMQSQSVSLAAAGTGIRVNAVVPGWIEVENECMKWDLEVERSVAAGERNRHILHEGKGQGKRWIIRPSGNDVSDGDQAWHPAGRVGRVEDMLKAVEFLAESGFVTGQEVVVDGGVGRKMVYPED